MRSIAAFIMKSRWRAVLTAVLLTITPVLELWCCAAPVALVTLRRGAKEGLWLILWVSAIMLLLYGIKPPGIYLFWLCCLGFFLPVWLLALVLRYTVSLAVTLQVGALALAMLALVIEVSGWLPTLPVMQHAAVAFYQQHAVRAWTEQDTQFVHTLVKTIVVGWPAVFFLCQAVMLFIGRWWQALLYNAGGFQLEFHALRLSRPVAVGLSLFVIAGSTLVPALPQSLVILAVNLLVIMGLGLIHWVFAAQSLSSGWLVLFYGLVFAFASPLLAVLGAVDGCVDVRAYVKQLKANKMK